MATKKLRKTKASKETPATFSYLSPGHAPVGSPPTEIDVIGSGFSLESKAIFSDLPPRGAPSPIVGANEVVLHTTFVSSRELRANVPAALLDKARSFLVDVRSNGKLKGGHPVSWFE